MIELIAGACLQANSALQVSSGALDLLTRRHKILRGPAYSAGSIRFIFWAGRLVVVVGLRRCRSHV